MFTKEFIQVVKENLEKPSVGKQDMMLERKHLDYETN